MDSKNGQQKWTAKMDSKNGLQKWTAKMDSKGLKGQKWVPLDTGFVTYAKYKGTFSLSLH